NTISLKQATDIEIGGIKVWKGTEEEYASLGTYDPDTHYFIEDLYPIGHRKVFEFLEDVDWEAPQSKNIPLDSTISAIDWDRKIRATICWEDPTTGYNDFTWYIAKGIITEVYQFNALGGNLSLSLNVSSKFTIPAG